jgi:hypothetical protein
VRHGVAILGQLCPQQQRVVLEAKVHGGVEQNEWRGVAPCVMDWRGFLQDVLIMAKRINQV